MARIALKGKARELRGALAEAFAALAAASADDGVNPAAGGDLRKESHPVTLSDLGVTKIQHVEAEAGL